LYHAVSSCFGKRIAQVNVGSGTSREFGYDSAGAPGERKRFCSRCRHSLKLCRSLQSWSCSVVNACPSTCQVTFGRRWNDMKLLLSFCGLFSSAKINPSNLFSITSHLWRLGWAQLVVCSIQITAPERYKICYCVWGCPSPWDRPEIATVAALPDTQVELTWFTVAIENGPFIVDFPIKNGDFP
jgi:hypothetical protein